MNVSEFVDPQLINTDLKANSRDGVLKEMAWLLHVRYPELNPQQISQKLISRENGGTTALPNGTALPHIRVSGLERPVILVGISKRGVIFGGSEPVKLFLLFLTPDDDTALHLKLLSMISSLLQNNKLIDMIKETHTREAVYRTFKMYRGKREYYVSLSSKEILVELDCKAEGLSSREAEKRLEEFGPNLLKAAVKENKIKKFSGNLVNALALIMWFGAALAFLIDLTIVGWSIIAVIFLNASFSFWQEYKAERALEALRAVIPRKVSCLRDGIEQEIDA